MDFLSYSILFLSVIILIFSLLTGIGIIPENIFLISYKQIMFHKFGFFISFFIYSIIFYVVLYLFVWGFLRVVNFLSGVQYSIFNFFLLIVASSNFIVYYFAYEEKKLVCIDFKEPINEIGLHENVLTYIYSRQRSIVMIFLFFFRNFQLAFAYGPLYSANLIFKDWIAISENRSYEGSDDHDAIIINIYNKLAPSGMLGCGIDLLINEFKNKRPYKIYFCSKRKEFFEILNNLKTKRIWVFGHGEHGGVRCLDGFCPYRHLVQRLNLASRNKDAVYQFHCNTGNVPSLVNLLSVKKGFVNHRTNSAVGIREYIRIIIQEKRLDDLIILE